jgi:phenylpyruvate tautomerase PptA (4-oxalocrotonate tautomerase family)
MPLLSIRTNVSLDEAQRADALRAASRAVAEMLGKPESYVMVHLEDGAALLFAGSDDPAAYLELKSLGLPEQETASFSSTLCALMADLFGLDPARVYIEFSGPARHMWGWNNATF